MAQKRNAKKKKTSNSVFYTNIAMLIFMLIFLLMVILKSKMGIVGELIAKGFFIVFGLTAYVAPLLILYIYFFIRGIFKKSNSGKKFLSIILIFFNIGILISIFSGSSGIYSQRIKDSYNLANCYLGPGFIASNLHFVMEKLVGNIGIYILTVANMVFSYITFSGKTFSGLVHEISYKAQGAKERIDQKRYERKEKKYLPKPDELEDEETLVTKDYTSRPSSQPSINYYKHEDDNDNDQDKPENDEGNLSQPAYDEGGEGLIIPDIYVDYRKPPVELLSKSSGKFMADSQELLKENGSKIVQTLASFGINVEIVNINSGPTVTSYEIKPEAGIKVSKIVNLSNDLSLSLATSGIRIEAPIPGKPYVGIEVPNRNKDSVTLRDLIVQGDFDVEDNDLTVALGKDLFGKPIYAKINEMPHMLIAGATGSGKSVCINTIIMSLIFKYSPDDVEFIMIDPKRVELSVYNGIAHLKGRKVVYDPLRATNSLEYAVREMVDRYEKFAKTKVRDITSYNENVMRKGIKKMPYLVVIVDELSDLMMESSKEVENHITRLAQMGRAAGVHLIIATQRPSVDVITGVIKANIPSRISFQVSSAIDSRTIIDMAGAEKLLGKGDMLYYPSKFPKPVRLQGAFVNDGEVERVVAYIKDQNDPVKTDQDFNKAIETKKNGASSGLEDEDELLEEAIEFVIREQQGSISAVQRRFGVGYSRAGRIIDQMEKLGIVGKHEGSKPRKILKDISYLTQQEMQEEDEINEDIEDEYSE